MDAVEAKWTLGDVEGATTGAAEEKGFLSMVMTGAAFLLIRAGMVTGSLVVRIVGVM